METQTQISEEEKKESMVEKAPEGNGKEKKWKWSCLMKCRLSKCQGKMRWFALGVVLLAVLFAAGGRFAWEHFEQKRMDSVKAKTEAFIKEKMIQPGTNFTITDFKEEGGLYKISISVGKQSVDAYVTKDGKRFFPGSIEMDKKEDASASSADPNAPAPVAEVTQKKDVPTVELFVMSYCPYGLQAEKGILPVIKQLGAKIRFDLKFVSYVMHGKKEFDENLNQYCIQKETPAKFLGYLDCFAKSAGGDSAKCMKSMGIVPSKVATCVAKTDQQYKLSDAFNGFDSTKGSYPPFDIFKGANEQYGVEGSPSLVINGQLVDSGRDSASVLKTICSGFTKQPAECSNVKALSSESPSAGFGEGTTAGGSDASCGN